MLKSKHITSKMDTMHNVLAQSMIKYKLDKIYLNHKNKASVDIQTSPKKLIIGKKVIIHACILHIHLEHQNLNPSIWLLPEQKNLFFFFPFIKDIYI